ncbi:MAG: uracil-DNA glycosylase family protein, partial [Nitrososphaeraceae archaeon]
MPNYIAGIGSVTPKLMIIGESPGKHEDEIGRPFVGPSGQILDNFLFKAGISRSECYINNVIKYRPPMNDWDKLHLIGVDVQQSIKELWDNEINLLKPNVILAIGNHALEAVTDVTGILNYRGSILQAKDGKTKVVPTIHPAALMQRGYVAGEENKGGLEWTYIKLIESDITRAAEESLTRDLNLPVRNLTIANNSLDVFRFFREYEKLDKAVTDIESINCVPVCIGFAFSRYHAISIPLLKSIGNVQLTNMGDNELDEVWREIDRQLRRLKLIGHNLQYDEYKLGLIGFQCPNVYSDTLIKIRVIFPELPKKTLAVLASILTREPFYKEEGKEFRLGKDNISRLLLYNGKDCAVNFECDEVLEQDLIDLSKQYNLPLLNYYYKYMMRKHKFYLKMSNNGFRVDLPRQAELK